MVEKALLMAGGSERWRRRIDVRAGGPADEDEGGGQPGEAELHVLGRQGVANQEESAPGDDEQRQEEAAQDRRKQADQGEAERADAHQHHDAGHDERPHRSAGVPHVHRSEAGGGREEGDATAEAAGRAFEQGADASASGDGADDEPPISSDLGPADEGSGADTKGGRVEVDAQGPLDEQRHAPHDERGTDGRAVAPVALLRGGFVGVRRIKVEVVGVAGHGRDGTDGRIRLRRPQGRFRPPPSGRGRPGSEARFVREHHRLHPVA